MPDFEARRDAYRDQARGSPAPANNKAVWHELLRMTAGGEPDPGVFEAALDFIDARQDCADFVLHGILRLLYQFGTFLEGRTTAGGRTGDQLPGEVFARARRSVLGFKYFPDEPGSDSLCTWTENHYILYTSAAYLAGQLYPDEVFSNSGETGRQKVEIHRARILRWLDLRFHTGFSEWLSHVYYDEDLAALLALYDFAADEEVRARAALVIDLLLVDMALNSLHGVFGSTHGRSYEWAKKWSEKESTSATAWLLFGQGTYSDYDNMSAAAFALSGYRLPPAIAALAGAATSTVSRQRMGIRLQEMERWGLKPGGFEDGMHALTLEAYLHPRTIANTLRMFDTCGWWDNAFLADFKPYQKLLRALGKMGLLPLLARALERDVCRNTREEVNLVTYRTPDSLLSTAQDYRKGYGGDQQHIWQATLGPGAVCFTTHPAKLSGVSPDYWTGSGLLPRAAQHRNVAIILYKIERIPALYVPTRHFFTHAWLPRDQFDEVHEQGGWYFARKGSAYLALRSRQPAFWNDAPDLEQKLNGVRLRSSQEDTGRELVAPGSQNIWICQLGREAEDGSFAAFIARICMARLSFRGLNIDFDSPGNGRIRFGWKGPLRVDGTQIPLREYPRYDHPCVQGVFGSDAVRVTCGGETLSLEWSSARRSQPGRPQAD
jgi:hypothetical protein